MLLVALGRSEWPVQRTKEAFGHWEIISAVEMKAAFDDLLLWVENRHAPGIS